MADLVVRASAVGKKYCRSLKRSMLYGATDLLSDFSGMRTSREVLRKEEFWALQGLDLELHRGECLGLLGRNGAGKSTLLKILNGIVLPDRGRVEVVGRSGALIEVGAGFHPLLTGRENVYVNGAILGLSKKEIDRKFDEVVDFAELSDFIDTPVKYYSSGMYVRLGFAVAVQMNPDLLLVDEVLAVGDAGFRAKCFNAVGGILKQSAVVFVSHSLPDVARICSRIMVLDEGGIVYDGRDVSEGINSYLKMVKSGDEDGVLISGSGKAVIDEVEMDTGGLEDNAPTQVRLSFKVKIDGSIRAPGINVSIISESGEFVAQANSCRWGQGLGHGNGWQQVFVDMGALNLRPGNYAFEIAVHEDGVGEVLVKKRGCSPFVVSGNFHGVAPILCDAKWLFREC